MKNAVSYKRVLTMFVLYLPYFCMKVLWTVKIGDVLRYHGEMVTERICEYSIILRSIKMILCKRSLVKICISNLPYFSCTLVKIGTTAIYHCGCRGDKTAKARRYFANFLCPEELSCPVSI